MAVLKRDDFMNSIKAKIGDDTSDDVISFLEDVNDTYTDLETKANNDNQNWKEKFTELDKTWREKYKQRFFSGTTKDEPDETDQPNEPPKKLTYENLFAEGDKK